MTKLIKIITILLIFLLALLMAGCGNDIFTAVEKGDINMVREFLAKNPGAIHSRDKNEHSLLHLAAFNGQSDMAQLLIDKGAKVDERTHDGNALTPLHLAAGQGHLKTVSLLIEKGADLEARGKGARYKAWNALVFAAWNAHNNMVELLIQKGSELKPVTLWFSVYSGNKDTVQLLLEKGVEVDVPEGKTWGPLHAAVEKGYLELVRLLLEHGVNVNRKASLDKTPLHAVIYWRKDHKEIVRLMLNNGAEVDAMDSYKETPLHKAAYKGWTKTAALLLEKGADVNIKNDMDRTPLDLAVLKGTKPVVRLLLQLHDAAGRGDFNEVNALVKKYPRLINSRDQDGKTPLHIAAEHNRVKIAALLIANGADVNLQSEYKSIQLLHGLIARLLVPGVGRIKRIKEEKTPLDLALQKGYQQMARLLTEQRKGK